MRFVAFPKRMGFHIHNGGTKPPLQRSALVICSTGFILLH